MLMLMVARRRSAAHTLLSSPLLDEGIPLEVAQRARRALGVLMALSSPPPSRGGGIKTETRARSTSINVCDQFNISAKDAQLVLFVSLLLLLLLLLFFSSCCCFFPPARRRQIPLRGKTSCSTSQPGPRHITQGPRPKQRTRPIFKCTIKE